MSSSPASQQLSRHEKLTILLQALQDALQFQDLDRLLVGFQPYTLRYDGTLVTLREIRAALNGQDLEWWLEPDGADENASRLRLAWIDNRSFERCSATLSLRLDADGMLESSAVSEICRAPAGSPASSGPGGVITCTSATHRTDALTALESTCCLYGVPLTIINKGAPYLGFGYNKLHTLYWFLRSHRHLATHILYVDAFDTLFATGLEPILKRYHLTGARVLFSAEVNCFPGGSGQNPADYPAAPTPFRFLNSGGFLAEIPALLALMDRFGATRVPVAAIDQGWWALVYLRSRPEVQLDHHCRIFQPLFEISDRIVFQGKEPHNLLTGSTPAILHGNGHTSLERFREVLLGRVPFSTRFLRRLQRRARMMRRVADFVVAAGIRLRRSGRRPGNAAPQ